MIDIGINLESCLRSNDDGKSNIHSCCSSDQLNAPLCAPANHRLYLPAIWYWAGCVQSVYQGLFMCDWTTTVKLQALTPKQWTSWGDLQTLFFKPTLCFDPFVISQNVDSGSFNSFCVFFLLQINIAVIINMLSLYSGVLYNWWEVVVLTRFHLNVESFCHFSFLMCSTTKLWLHEGPAWPQLSLPCKPDNHFTCSWFHANMITAPDSVPMCVPPCICTCPHRQTLWRRSQ